MIGGGRGIEDAMRDLSALRAQLGPTDRQLGNYIDGTLGYLRHLNGQSGILDSTINQDAVTSLERLEVELSRRVGQQQAEGARTGATETAPEKYRDSVAEYFRKLSK